MVCALQSKERETNLKNQIESDTITFDNIGHNAIESIITL